MPPVANPPANLENLFASLVNAGFISSSAAPQATDNAVPTATSNESSSTPTPEDDRNLKESAVRDYRNAILSEPIKLTTSDLAKYVGMPHILNCYLSAIVRAKPRIVDYLYDRQISQCKQCGVRFADTKLGKKQMDDHLDMHFRQNSKLDQGRGQSRSWFISLDVCNMFRHVYPVLISNLGLAS